MIRARVLLLFSLLLWPQILWAGAWPRDEGKGFLSFSIEASTETPEDSPVSLFVEYGLKNNVTLGFDGGGRQTDLTKAIAFLRWPLRSGAQSSVAAVEMGAGFVDDSLALRPALSWGRGTKVFQRSAWISVDMRGLIYDHAEGLLETDFTFGIKPNARSMIILQLQSGVPSDGEPYARLAPSFVFETKPGRHIELGATTGLINSDDLRIKVGMWLRF